MQRVSTGLPVISLDQLRQEMGIDPRRNQYAVAKAAQQLAKERLRRGEPFVWNATNLTRRIREPLVDLFHTYCARTHIVYLHVPVQRAVEQNRQREDCVPEPVIHELLGKLDVPSVTEAHRVSVVEAANGPSCRY